MDLGRIYNLVRKTVNVWDLHCPSLILLDESSCNKYCSRRQSLEILLLSFTIITGKIFRTFFPQIKAQKVNYVDHFYPAILNEVETMVPEISSSLITRYLRFTAWSERELSVHPRCLHSFSNERWTWTSSDRTPVNVYLAPFLSSWEFALRPDRKPLASPLNVPSPLFTAASAVEQHDGYHTDWSENPKPQENTRHRWQRAQTGGQYLWRNVYCEL